MWRVLVPLDGSAMAESVLPDAKRLAGPGGTIMLVIDEAACRDLVDETETSGSGCAEYLARIERSLRAQDFVVEVHIFDIGDPASVIERAAAELHADIMAVATHARTSEERWQRGSVAWTALMRSVVPVLLRRALPVGKQHGEGRGLLVPLDGSGLAEGALPLAQALAVRWNEPIWLLQVLDESRDESSWIDSEAYLTEMAEGMSGDVHVRVRSGPVDETIASVANEIGVTNIVMTSHGKTGLTRAIVGSVADEVIHRVDCPVIILPPLLTLGEEAHNSLLMEQETTAAT